MSGTRSELVGKRTPASVTNILDRLEEKGCGRRVRSEIDARQIRVSTVEDRAAVFR